jgi:hypothetical protein
MLLKASLPKKPHPAVQRIGDLEEDVLELLSILKNFYKRESEREKGKEIKKKGKFIFYL